MNKQLTVSDTAVVIGADGDVKHMTVPPIKADNVYIKIAAIGLVAIIAYKVLK